MAFQWVIIEAKEPSVEVLSGLREARLYAIEINKRYPPNINPIAFVMACNGEQIALSPWDSEVDLLQVSVADVQPGSSILEALKSAIGLEPLQRHADQIDRHYRGRTFYNTAAFLGGQARLGEQLGLNSFAGDLLPLITKYFGNEAEEARDEIIGRAYVSSDELGRYGAVLETYLKDRVRQVAGSQVQPIITGRQTASGLSTELQVFTSNPSFYGRVQLIIGAVGSGKSTFIERYYKNLMPKQLKERTLWSFLDFNSLSPSQDNIQNWVASTFIESFKSSNMIDLDDIDVIEKVLAAEINRFEKGPAKLLKKDNIGEYTKLKVERINTIVSSPVLFAQCIAGHFGGERGRGIVIVFDNVDKRSRDLQLDIFEAAQWFKDLTRSMVIVNLRDTTFEAHRDEKPLDAFVNAVNFYIRPPRFAQVIKRRLELVFEKLPDEMEKRHSFSVEGGQRISVPASRLGDFMLGIYTSLFEQCSIQVAASLEALVAKDVRRALGMFADLIVSPHIPVEQMTVAGVGDEGAIRESRIIRALMRGRYRYFNNASKYIFNILKVDVTHRRPSNLIYADILDFLIRNRKAKLDFSTEGYALVSTVVARMTQIGYDEEDSFRSVQELVTNGLVEPESLVLESLGDDDAVRVHASGFIHLRYFSNRLEYVAGVTPVMSFSSRSVAEGVAGLWSGRPVGTDIGLGAKRKLAERMAVYFRKEYDRRCNRHAFYRDLGFGGRYLVNALEGVANWTPQAQPGRQS